MRDCSETTAREIDEERFHDPVEDKRQVADSDGPSGPGRRHGPLGDIDHADQHRTVAVAHRSPRAEQCVAIVEVRVRVDRNRGHLVGPFEGLAVEALDVRQHVLEAQPTRVDELPGQGIEHEGVVRVRRVRHANESHPSSDFP